MPSIPQCLIRQGLSIVPTLKPTDHIPVLTDVVNIGPMSHAGDPHTSYEAGDKARGRANHLRVASLVALYMYGPATSDEIAERLGVQREDIARRCTELLQSGKIMRRQTGTHHGKPTYHTRNSSRGCAAVVWYVTAQEAA